MMTRAQVQVAISDAERLGCRAYYYTGGEPFLHPEILDLIDDGLASGPLHILTNGMLITREIAAELAHRSAAADYSLDLRVSLDGLSAAANDPIRGEGVFEATTTGIRRLVEAGIEPSLALTLVDPAGASPEGRTAMLGFLRALGVERPRLKLIPPFRIGREAARSGRYGPEARLAAEDLDDEAPWQLGCGTSRMVTANGVYTCPILIDYPSARLGDGLAKALVPIPLAYRACFTCWEEGFSCRS